MIKFMVCIISDPIIQLEEEMNYKRLNRFAFRKTSNIARCINILLNNKIVIGFIKYKLFILLILKIIHMIFKADVLYNGQCSCDG